VYKVNLWRCGDFVRGGAALVLDHYKAFADYNRINGAFMVVS